MIGRSTLRRLLRADDGAMAVEFALLAPVFITMLMGVLQIGMALQNYNALRNVSADVARHAMVQAQSGNDLSNSQLRTFTQGHARGAPYLLRSNRFSVIVVNAATQRVTGAREIELTVTYQIDSLLESFGFPGPLISYERPIFVIDS